MDKQFIIFMLIMQAIVVVSGSLLIVGVTQLALQIIK